MKKIITNTLLIGLFLVSSIFGLQAARRQQFEREVDPRDKQTQIADSVNGHINWLFHHGYSMEDRVWYVNQNIKTKRSRFLNKRKWIMFFDKLLELIKQEYRSEKVELKKSRTLWICPTSSLNVLTKLLRYFNRTDKIKQFRKVGRNIAELIKKAKKRQRNTYLTQTIGKEGAQYDLGI